LQKNKKSKLAFAKKLRTKMTPAERVLWQRLRNKKIKRKKFRRQVVIGGFIADFFCISANLVIEVDGSIHDLPEQKEVDELRTKVFESRGLKVIRFTNNEVFDSIDKVIATITKNIMERT